MGKTRPSAYMFAVAYLALIVGLFLALGGAAYAQSPATDQYGDKVKVVENVNVVENAKEVENVEVADKVKGVQVSETAGGNTASVAAESQALPNTGLSLLGAVLVGGALVAGGLVLRRREQRKS